jgi:hypothetical protein
MCMIIYKPVGVELPDRETIRQAALGNPHGAGVMIADKGKVEIYKALIGADTICDLLSVLDRDNDKLINKSLAIHFRMATHGEVSIANCHPFPVTDDDLLLSSGSCKVDVALAHNGMFWNREYNKRDSDTYQFVKKYLSGFTWETFKAAYNLLDDESFRTDRVIVMNGAGDVIKWGTWHTEKGCEYSTFPGRSYSVYNYGYGAGDLEDMEWERGWRGNRNNTTEYTKPPQLVWDRETGECADFEDTGKEESICAFCKEKVSAGYMVDLEAGYSVCLACYRAMSAPHNDDGPADDIVEEEFCDYCGSDRPLSEIKQYRYHNYNIAICQECEAAGRLSSLLV